jgi:Flp pilus assembly protein protease CpaA
MDTITNLPSGMPTGHWIIAIYLTALPAAILLEEGARKLPKILGWQEDGKTKTHDRNNAAIVVCWISTCVAATIWQDTLEDACLAAIFTALLNYCAIQDIRDRWIPDHPLIALTLIGLIYSPAASLQNRVDGYALCLLLMPLWNTLSHLAAKREISTDIVHGGDMMLAGAGGAWLGADLGLIGFLIGLSILGMGMIIVKSRSIIVFDKISMAMGVSQGDKLMPAGACYALGFWLALMYQSRYAGIN